MFKQFLFRYIRMFILLFCSVLSEWVIVKPSVFSFLVRRGCTSWLKINSHEMLVLKILALEKCAYT